MHAVSAWSVFRKNGRFRRLWLAQLISFGGDFISQVALSSLIFQLTGKASMVAALALASTLPVFLASPWAGVAADRYPRIRVMLICDILRAALILGLLWVKGASQIWLALLVVAATETVSAFFEPASAAALPTLVEPQELPGAIALSSASWSCMLAVGAALGGVITSHWGSQAAFVTNSLTYLISATLLIGLPMNHALESQPEAQSAWQELRQGLTYVGQHPQLGALLLIKISFGLGTGVLSLLTVLPLQFFAAGQAGVAEVELLSSSCAWAVTVLGGDETTNGWLQSARGLGAVGGPLLAQRWMNRSLGSRALLAGWGIVLTGVFYALVAQAPTLAWAALWVVTAHLGSGVQWVLSTTLLQQCSQDRFRGRVMALDFAGVTLSMALSTMAFGYAMDAFGARHVGMVGSLLLSGLGLLWLVASGRGRDRWKQPDGDSPEDSPPVEAPVGGARESAKAGRLSNRVELGGDR